jgi:hypothetical protein
MSCGNRFSCGIKRFQQPSFAPDRPSNPELHQENENRLSELMRMREEQDKMHSFQPIKGVNFSPKHNISSSSDNTYTPWVPPAASDVTSKK